MLEELDAKPEQVSERPVELGHSEDGIGTWKVHLRSVF
jgi:hypothetical protein